MIRNHIPYDVLVQDALRRVVRHVLADVAKNGLPGEHHFFIAFSTHMVGVDISPRLKERYPDQMTIVLQHQFWDLLVEEDYFTVTLSFGDVPEKLIIPFAAVQAFYDPAAAFEAVFDVPSSQDTPPNGQVTQEQDAQIQDGSVPQMIPLPAHGDENGKITVLTRHGEEKKNPPVADLSPWRKQEQGTKASQIQEVARKDKEKAENNQSPKDNSKEDKSGGDVISLDAFRKR